MVVGLAETLGNVLKARDHQQARNREAADDDGHDTARRELPVLLAPHDRLYGVLFRACPVARLDVRVRSRQLELAVDRASAQERDGDDRPEVRHVLNVGPTARSGPVKGEANAGNAR